MISVAPFVLLFFVQHSVLNSHRNVNALPSNIIHGDALIAHEESVLNIDDFIRSAQMVDSELSLTGLDENERRIWKARKTAADIVKYPDKAIKRIEEVSSRKPNGSSRSAMRGQTLRWPNGEIPYTLSRKYGPASRGLIAKAMVTFQNNTCLRFVPKDSNKHRDYVKIVPDNGCYSMIGRVGGAQPLSLDDGCMELGIILHELMHSTGFIHEHSRSDRDKYVKIIWKNIVPEFKEEFEKYNDYITDNLGYPYDYSSIMHYDNMAFSRNGKPTMVAQKGRNEDMGQRDRFTNLDLKKIAKYYDGVCSSNNWNSQDWDDAANTLHQITTGAKCNDKNGHCSEWSTYGFCDNVSYREFMITVCPASCNVC